MRRLPRQSCIDRTESVGAGTSRRRSLCWDEIDAALDATNVARVAAYIRDKTHAADESFQSIVISLKDIFYEKADALLGVARDTDRGCSKTLTFDLNAYS